MILRWKRLNTDRSLRMAVFNKDLLINKLRIPQDLAYDADHITGLGNGAPDNKIIRTCGYSFARGHYTLLIVVGCKIGPDSGGNDQKFWIRNAITDASDLAWRGDNTV